MDNMDACTRRDGNDRDDHRPCGGLDIQFSFDGNQPKRLGFFNRQCNDESSAADGPGEFHKYGTNVKFRVAFVGGAKQPDRLRVGVQKGKRHDMDNVDTGTGRDGNNRDDHRTCGEHGVQFPLDGDQHRRLGFFNRQCNDEDRCTDGPGGFHRHGSNVGFRDAFVGDAKQFDRLHAGVQVVNGIDMDDMDACSGSIGDQCDDHRPCGGHGI